MPFDGVNLGTIKERAEAVLVTPTSTLTELPNYPGDRLMANHSTPNPHLNSADRVRS